MSFRKVWLILMATVPLQAAAQLQVTSSHVKIAGQKAIVPLALKNNFTQTINSARAAVFVSDERGKVVGQATRWVIGGAPDKSGLEPKATNAFHFVVTSSKPLESTNLTAKVVFTRLVLEGGKSVDPKKNVVIKEGK